VKVQKTPVFIGDVTLAHLSHLFLGGPGGRFDVYRAFPVPSKEPRIDIKPIRGNPKPSELVNVKKQGSGGKARSALPEGDIEKVAAPRSKLVKADKS
jgi:hypothetical protein